MHYNFVKTSLLMLPLCAFAVVGCESHSKTKDSPQPTLMQHDQIGQLDRWAVESPSRASVDSAIIRQSTLYDYHFVDGMASLTPVGRRDVVVLARHFRGDDWLLRMRQGSAGDDLYQDRMDTVRELLERYSAESGVTIVDALPGGAGLASEDARRIRKEAIMRDQAEQSTGGSGNGSDRPMDTPLEGGS